MTRAYAFVLLSAALLGTAPSARSECTDILVTKGASAEGACMITYACDGEFHPHLSRTPAAIHSAPPLLGADSEAVLQELGFSPEEISHLREQGII